MISPVIYYRYNRRLKVNDGKPWDTSTRRSCIIFCYFEASPVFELFCSYRRCNKENILVDILTCNQYKPSIWSWFFFLNSLFSSSNWLLLWSSTKPVGFRVICGFIFERFWVSVYYTIDLDNEWLVSICFKNTTF